MFGEASCSHVDSASGANRADGSLRLPLARSTATSLSRTRSGLFGSLGSRPLPTTSSRSSWWTTASSTARTGRPPTRWTAPSTTRAAMTQRKEWSIGKRIEGLVAADAKAAEEDELTSDPDAPLPAHVKVTRGHPRARDLQVRFREDEFDELAAHAEQRGLPVSTVIRALVLQAIAPTKRCRGPFTMPRLRSSTRGKWRERPARSPPANGLRTVRAVGGDLHAEPASSAAPAPRVSCSRGTPSSPGVRRPAAGSSRRAVPSPPEVAAPRQVPR